MSPLHYLFAQDLRLTFCANGRNVEFYSGDQYVQTMKGDSSGGKAGEYTYTLQVKRPVWPIMAKVRGWVIVVA